MPAGRFNGLFAKGSIGHSRTDVWSLLNDRSRKCRNLEQSDTVDDWVHVRTIVVARGQASVNSSRKKMASVIECSYTIAGTKTSAKLTKQLGGSTTYSEDEQMKRTKNAQWSIRTTESFSDVARARSRGFSVGVAGQAKGGGSAKVEKVPLLLSISTGRSQGADDSEPALPKMRSKSDTFSFWAQATAVEEERTADVDCMTA
ncbi:hypothetical protein BKA62DRAFT_758863 [Auriculariales sp. MPI-PUGE-AT-0066]|nr:hypothetical protein BKA62DRAFT_758863 [Auriculariales sp. MPI-PUGE-AT-0066]